MPKPAWSQMYIPISWMMAGRKLRYYLKKHFTKKNLDPQMHPNTVENTVAVPEGVDAELLAKVLNNPEMAALLTSLAKTMMQVMPPSPDWKEPLQVPYIIFPTFPRTGNNYFAPCSLPLLESCQSKKHKFIR